MNETEGEAKVEDALGRARSHAPFLDLQLRIFPEISEVLAEGRGADAITLALEAGRDAEDIAAALRRERNAFALALAINDLAGTLSLEGLTRELSDLADRSLERALAAAIEERTPGAGTDGFAIIALGKLGSRELNYSSDVDLLLLYDPERLAVRPREEPSQAAVRIAQRLVELLQKRDGDGYAFRVDLRLRPSPEVTPIALAVNAAISHYESSALPWERAAFIRARAVAGDAALGRYFLDALHPFIWRRSLDFGAIGELQSITRRIRDHYAEGQGFGRGFDLKRGRGGIREIEFFAQVHQLIHGGREPELRAPATLDALETLAAAARIDEAEARVLGDTYRLLRTIEHRLQMVDDRQTHSLPAEAGQLDNVARLHGLADGSALLGLLEEPVARTSAIYARLGSQSESDALPGGEAPLEARLSDLGFAEPGPARQRIEGWRAGKGRSLRTSAAKDAFEAMLPRLIAAFGKAPDPLRAINRFDDIVSRLPSGVNFYRLLEARPNVTELLATILSHAPALADQLARRPNLLDGLLDASAFAPVPPVAELAVDFARPERADEDYQQALDRVRRRVNERRFALGVQVIVGADDPLEVTAGYSRVAEAAIEVLANAAIAEFESRHGRVPGSELLIMALGRLGGEALTHASDLDLVYLFTGSFEAESDGEKPLRATDYFNRLAPRISAALSVATAAGPLYEVDTRLRPSGTDGMLAINLDSFATYQREQAWTWEHMALTRARPVYGSADGRAELNALIDTVLKAERDAAKLVADAAAMRVEMAAHKPPAGAFDIKLGPGGLVDLEFAVHTLQLRHRVGLDPHLEVALAALQEAGFVSPEIDPALRFLSRLLVTLRLVSPDSAEPPEASRALVAQSCGIGGWEALTTRLAEARAEVSRLWEQVRSVAP